jgi:RNA polymerase sigma-70 factor (ECF subfamily)
MLKNAISIIEGCIRKDHKCQKMIYEHFRGYALKIVFRYVHSYDKAVDVVNDGFVKLFNHFPDFQSTATYEDEKILMGWLKRIMINSAIDELRKGKNVVEGDDIPDDVWDLSAKTDNADQTLLYNDLIVLIKKLPYAYRMVFNLYVIDGYTHQEIATLLKMSVGTSKSSLSRARALLQKNIKNVEGKLWRG